MVLTRELTFNIDGNVSSVGLPVNGTRVRLYDYWQGSGCLIKHFLCEQTTTNRGAFSFNVRKGIYALEFLPNENTRYARQSIEAVKVTKNKAINVSLKAGSILSGIVRNSDGCIVTNAELLVFGIETGGLKTSQLIDEHGMFNITLPQGKYYLALKYQPKE
ncbi:MAG: hypothetical protein K2X29_03785, partial [Candidatus Obscuribacterales bacterium]|nr:hypothetical protein [Candidatus Obscuribacterales bacterium]